MFSVRENIEAFDAANGTFNVTVGNWIYFANGARRERNPLGMLCDPPQNNYQLLKHKEIFFTELHRRAVEDFSKQKADYLNDAKSAIKTGRSPSSSPEQATAELSKLKQKVRDAKKVLDNIQNELQATPQEQARLLREDSRATAKTQGEELFYTVGKFTL